MKPIKINILNFVQDIRMTEASIFLYNNKNIIKRLKFSIIISD